MIHPWIGLIGLGRMTDPVLITVVIIATQMMRFLSNYDL